MKHLSMNVPRFIYVTHLIRIFRKAGVFEAQTTDEVSKCWDSEEALGVTAQNMAKTDNIFHQKNQVSIPF
jgi:hypothetical protein